MRRATPVRRLGTHGASFVPAIALVVAMALVVAAGACKKPRRVVLTKEQKEQIQSHVLAKAPADLTSTVGADFDSRLKLIGVKLSKTKANPGDTVDVTYYWEALKPVKGEWKVFVHFENATPPKQKRQLLDHHPVGELYPISQWKEGEIIEDIQHVRLDSDWPAGTATFWVGVFDDEAWRERGENARLGVINKDQVPTDGDGRVRAATLEVLPKKGAADADRKFVRSYGASKLPEGQAIVVDGKLDEAAWRLARPTQPFVQPNGAPLDGRIQSRARLAWDDKKLYIAFNVQDDDIWNPLEGRDATLWKDDVVEVYLDPGADGKDYVELQVSPTNQVFDAHFSSHRAPKWEDAASRFTAAIETAVEVEGSANQRDDGKQDKGWTVEMAIPFASLPGLSGPPKAGDKWTLNLYRLDSKGAGTMANQGAWAPAGGDFHNLTAAGTLTFRDATVAPPRPPVKAPPVTAPGVPPTVRPSDSPVVPPAKAEEPKKTGDEAKKADPAAGLGVRGTGEGGGGVGAGAGLGSKTPAKQADDRVPSAPEAKELQPQPTPGL